MRLSALARRAHVRPSALVRCNDSLARSSPGPRRPELPAEIVLRHLRKQVRRDRYRCRGQNSIHSAPRAEGSHAFLGDVARVRRWGLGDPLRDLGRRKDRAAVEAAGSVAPREEVAMVRAEAPNGLEVVRASHERRSRCRANAEFTGKRRPSRRENGRFEMLLLGSHIHDGPRLSGATTR